VLEEEPKFSEGNSVKGIINTERRKQLTQHHTGTHIINAAARIILGPHINQAGAKKDTDKAYIDITHYQNITEEEQEKIEQEANRIVKKALPVTKKLMPKAEAEKAHGFAIYQGGVAPGKTLRIVETKGVDTEACGGTHLNNTSEAETIRIIRTTKIKDGIVRIAFAAGKAAKKIAAEEKAAEQEIAKLLDCRPAQIPARAQELFEKWKKARKGRLTEFKLASTETYEGKIIAKTAEILQTQPEHITKTIQRFLKEITGMQSDK
jgi:alanyl-tRNA synthetase